MCVYLDEQDGQFKASTAADFSWSVAVSKCRIAIEAFINRSHLLHRGVIKGLALSQDIRYKLYPTYYSIRYSRTCTLRRACSFGSDTTRDVFDGNGRSLLCDSLYVRQYKFAWLKLVLVFATTSFSACADSRWWAGEYRHHLLDSEHLNTVCSGLE